MSEDAPPPEVVTSEAAPEKLAERQTIAGVLATHLHAILVGVFTLASSVISALLGHYFAHEDRQSMLALEYDKLRAEHTLEIVKALTTAEAHMIAVSVEGAQAQLIVCGLRDRIKTFATRIATAKPPPALKGDPAFDLGELDLHLKSPDIAPELREAWQFELGMMKAEFQSTEETIQSRRKTYNDLARKLLGDTAATIRVYHRDRDEDYTKLTTTFLQLNLGANKLMWPAVCGAEAKWDALMPKLMDWNSEATKFSDSLGIALKPE